MIKKVFESSLYIHSLYSKPKGARHQPNWAQEFLEEISQIQKVDIEGQKWSAKN
jgi:hypothetical protein